MRYYEQSYMLYKNGVDRMKKLLSILLVFAILFVSFSVSVYAEYDYEPIVEKSGTYMYLANIKDISEYENEEKITELCIKNCFISSDTKIFSHKKLEDVRLINCTFDKGRYDFPDNIKILQIEENIPDNVIRGIGNVEELTFWGYEGEDMSSFSVLKHIENLSLSEFKVKSLKGIGKLTSLRYLFMDDIGIQNIDELKKLKNLRELTINGSFIEDLSPIENLKLDYLDVEDNYNLKSLDPVTKISTLTTLWATNCEMAYTEKLVNFVEKNNISSNVNKKGLTTKKKVEALADKLVNNRMSDEEKIGTIIKYICDNMEYTLPPDRGDEYTYDYEYNQLLEKYNDKALDYALKGEGCCANYAALTYALLSESGIDAFCISGEEHIWNLVETGGYYYWLDTTWIDTGYDSTLDESFWYMNSSEDFTISHEYYALPVEVTENSNAFGKTFTHTMSFMLADFFPDNTEEETTEEKTTEEKTTVAESTEESTEEVTENTEEETTAAEEDGEASGGKKILIISVSLVILLGAASVIIIIKKKKQSVENTDAM